MVRCEPASRAPPGRSQASCTTPSPTPARQALPSTSPRAARRLRPPRRAMTTPASTPASAGAASTANAAAGSGPAPGNAPSSGTAGSGPGTDAAAVNDVPAPMAKPGPAARAAAHTDEVGKVGELDDEQHRRADRARCQRAMHQEHPLVARDERAGHEERPARELGHDGHEGRPCPPPRGGGEADGVGEPRGQTHDPCACTRRSGRRPHRTRRPGRRRPATREAPATSRPARPACPPARPARAARRTRSRRRGRLPTARAGGQDGSARLKPAAMRSPRGSRTLARRRPANQQAVRGTAVSPIGSRPTTPCATCSGACWASSHAWTASATTWGHDVPVPPPVTHAATAGATITTSAATTACSAASAPDPRGDRSGAAASRVAGRSVRRLIVTMVARPGRGRRPDAPRETPRRAGTMCARRTAPRGGSTRGRA